MSENSKKIMDLAKNLFGKGEEEAQQIVEEGKAGGNDLFDMAKGLVGNLGDGDMDMLNIAKNVLGGMDNPVDIFQALKDGKLDMKDLLTLGKILSKVMK